MNMKRTALTLALLATGMGAAWAADHRDSPLTMADPAADINDVYAFVNPNDADEVILVATVLPVANANSRFSDVVEYRFHISNGSEGGDALITCTFPEAATRVLCRGEGDTLFAEGKINEVVDADELRVFAGLRDDPFFFDLDAFNETKATLVPAFTDPGVNFFAGLNTLSIVLGISSDRLTDAGENPTLKVYASTERTSGAGVGPGFTGLWWDPANAGHGLVLQVIESVTANDAKAIAKNHLPYRLVAYWNVFDNEGEQLALYGIGDIEANGDTASVPVVSGSGPMFPPAFDADDLVETPFGTLDFTFTDCNHGSLSVTPTREGFAPVTIPLERATSVVGQSCTLNKLGQVDRMGRPGINTALIDLLASTGKKDAYNIAADPAGWAAAFTAEIQTNLGALDTLDGVNGNNVLPPAGLAPVLVDDRLVINTSIPTCDAYLAVELGVPGQCGGRTLARDVIDDTFGAVIGPGVSDNVDNDSTFLADFPFLGAAN